MYQGVRMSANKGLGRGLEVLLGGNIATEKSEGQNNLIAIDAIAPNPSQPRSPTSRGVDGMSIRAPSP